MQLLGHELGRLQHSGHAHTQWGICDAKDLCHAVRASVFLMSEGEVRVHHMQQLQQETLCRRGPQQNHLWCSRAYHYIQGKQQ